MTPVVYINGVRAEVTGSISEWRAVREMTEAEPSVKSPSRLSTRTSAVKLGEAVSTTTNGSAACIGEECPRDDDLGPLEGKWKLDFAGVGPSRGRHRPGSTFPTRVLTGRAPAGLTISTNSVPTVLSGMSRATRPGWKPGRALPRMLVARRLRLTMAAITPSSSTTRKRQPCS